jgi:hypothetical protein
MPSELAIREALSGNICRCTGYGRIIDAVQRRRRGPHRRAERRMSDGHESRGPALDPALALDASVTARVARTASPRCRARSRSPRTLRRRLPVGRDVAVNLILTPASSASTCRRRGGSPASRLSSTADDVPGQPSYGLISQDQPVFARDVVRYVGEPIAAVAADHPETCRRRRSPPSWSSTRCSNR